MRALGWLAAAAALLLAGTWLWLLLAGPVRERVAEARRPAYCDLVTLCDHAAPPPVELRLGAPALPASDRDHAAVLAAGGLDGAPRVQAYDLMVSPLPGTAPEPLPGGQEASSRLFLVRGSGADAVVVVRDTFTQRHARLLRRGRDLARFRVLTDARAGLARFALLDRATNKGDTFQLRQAERSETFDYLVLAPDSPEIHAQWLRARQSSCGGGPLTAVPPEWERAYQDACRRR